MSSGFLSGVTVLGLASVGPAARASRWLADYGATVVKVGPVPSAGGVQVVPPFHAYGANRGMKRLLVDLKTSDGVEVFLRLARQSDVVIESFRPGVVQRLGIDYETVRTRHAGVVYCSTSGYGRSGPYSQWAGHDLDYLALGGFLDCSGRDQDGGPSLPGTTVADTAAGGMHAVVAILAALLHRGRTGEGAYLDVSVAEGVLSLMSLQIDAYLATGDAARPGRGVLHGQYACYAMYRAKDGGWLSVAAIEPKFWANLCRELGLERWTSSQLDDSVQDRIRDELRQVFATRDRDDWVRTLSPRDTCVSPALSVPEVVDDSHFTARGIIGEVDHPVHGSFRQLMPTLAGTVRPSGVQRLPDPQHTDTDRLLADAGFSTHESAQLREMGVVA